MILFEGHTFSRSYPYKDNSYAWRCSKKDTICKAMVRLNDDGELTIVNSVHTHQKRPSKINENEEDRVEEDTDKTYEIMTSSRGSEMILFQGHTFSKAYKCTKGSSYAWRCSKKDTKCKAMVKLNDDGELTICNSEHTHQLRDRPKIKNITFEEETDKTYEMVTTGKGGELLLFEGYTFYKAYLYKKESAYAWRCSKKRTKCKATVKVNENGKLTVVNSVHSCTPWSSRRQSLDSCKSEEESEEEKEEDDNSN